MSFDINLNNPFLQDTIETAVSSAILSGNLGRYSSYDAGAFTEEVLADVGLGGLSSAALDESLYYVFALAVESLFVEGVIGGGSESSERFVVGAILAHPAFRRWVYQQPFYQAIKDEVFSAVQRGARLFGTTYLREYIRERIVGPVVRIIDRNKRLWLDQVRRSVVSSYHSGYQNIQDTFQEIRETFQERGFLDGTLRTSADLIERGRGISFKGHKRAFSLLDGSHLINAVQFAGLTGLSVTPLLYTTANYSDLALRVSLSVAGSYSGYVTTATLAANLLAPVVRERIFPQSSERAIQAFVLDKGLQIQQGIADLDEALQVAPVFIQESIRRAPDLVLALALATGCFSSHIQAAFATPYVFREVGTALKYLGFSSSSLTLKNKLKKAPIQLLLGSCAQLALGDNSYVEITSIAAMPFVLEKIETTGVYQQFYSNMENWIFPKEVSIFPKASWRMSQIERIFEMPPQLTWVKQLPQVVSVGKVLSKIRKKEVPVQMIQRVAQETLQAGQATYMGYVRISLMEGLVGNFASLIELIRNPLSPTKITAVAAGALIHTYSEDPLAAAFTIPVVEQVIENSGIYSKIQSKIYEWGSYLKSWVISSDATDEQ